MTVFFRKSLYYRVVMNHVLHTGLFWVFAHLRGFCREKLEEAGPVTFYCQHPPTVRLQPGRSRWARDQQLQFQGFGAILGF